MRSAAAAALLLLGACGREGPRDGSICPHDPGFDRSRMIRVRADARPPVLRRDLDLAALAKESGGSVGTGKPQGLTEVDNQLSFHTLMNMEAVGGRACVWLDEVRIDLTPASVQIFVPREYAEDSCEYIAVLEHEREHERVHRERLDAAVKEIEQALTEARWLPGKGNPMATDDRDSAEAALKAKIRKVVIPAYQKYKADLGSAQLELDKPELYQWVSKRCSGWK